MSQSFWKRDSADVARALRGFSLLINGHEAAIIDVSAYNRAEQERGLYKPMLDMDAGSVYCPKMMSSILLCIVTGRGSELGSCVRVDDIELDGIRHTGPGKVTRALGITLAKSVGEAEVLDDVYVEIRIGDQPRRVARRTTIRKDQIKQEPPIGRKALARLLPAIDARYMKERPSISFEAYLSALLTECPKESELRKKIGAH